MAKTEDLNDLKREYGQVDKTTHNPYENNAFKKPKPEPKLANKETDSYDHLKQKLDPSQSQQKHSTQPQMPGDIVVYHAHISGDEMKRCHTCHSHLKDCCRRSIFAEAAGLPREQSGNESRQVIHRHSFDVIVVKRLSKL